MTTSSSLVASGAVVDGILGTDGRDLFVASVLASVLASFTGSTNGNGVGVTNGITSITFAANQTLPAGHPLVFASQPGVVYYLASAITAGTAGTLTEPYTGTTNAGTNATNIMSATYTTVAGFTFTDSTAQTLPVGFEFLINGGAGSFAGVVYSLVTAVTTDVMTVSKMSPETPLPGNGTLVTLTTAHGNGSFNPITLAQEATGGATDTTSPVIKRVVQRNGSATQLMFTPWGNLLAQVALVAATVTPTVGGTAITFGADQTLAAGTQLIFASQPNKIYTLAAAISGAEAGTLTTIYNGPSGSTTATGVAAQVLQAAAGGTYNLVGADNQPVQVVVVPSSSLYP
jgi:hypothetical protein